MNIREFTPRKIEDKVDNALLYSWHYLLDEKNSITSKAAFVSSSTFLFLVLPGTFTITEIYLGYKLIKNAQRIGNFVNNGLCTLDNYL